MKNKFDLPQTSILKFAKGICDKEDIDYDLVALNRIVENLSNDVRTTMIDIFTLSFDKKITLEDTNRLVIGRKTKMFLGVTENFLSKDFCKTRNHYLIH